MKENSTSSSTSSKQERAYRTTEVPLGTSPGSPGWTPLCESLQPKSKHNPDHYQMGSIQVWDFIIDQDLDFILGNVVKYVCRAGAKPGESRLDDLKKAQAYINKAISTCTDV